MGDGAEGGRVRHPDGGARLHHEGGVGGRRASSHHGRVGG